MIEARAAAAAALDPLLKLARKRHQRQKEKEQLTSRRVVDSRNFFNLSRALSTRRSNGRA